MRLTRDQWDELVAHAREEAPNECCGVIRLRDGSGLEVHRGQNKRKSPYGYDLDDKSLFLAAESFDDGDQVAIYHSHPKSAAEPSQMDINLAKYNPHYVQVIVSLADEPDVRAWRIEDGAVFEDPVELA